MLLAAISIYIVIVLFSLSLCKAAAKEDRDIARLYQMEIEKRKVNS